MRGLHKAPQLCRRLTEQGATLGGGEEVERLGDEAMAGVVAALLSDPWEVRRPHAVIGTEV